MTHHCRNVLISLNWDAHVAKFQVFCLGGCSLSQQTSFFSESKQLHIWQHPRQYIIGKTSSAEPFLFAEEVFKDLLIGGQQGQLFNVRIWDLMGLGFVKWNFHVLCHRGQPLHEKNPKETFQAVALLQLFKQLFGSSSSLTPSSLPF